MQNFIGAALNLAFEDSVKPGSNRGKIKLCFQIGIASKIRIKCKKYSLPQRLPLSTQRLAESKEKQKKMKFR